MTLKSETFESLLKTYTSSRPKYSSKKIKLGK